MRHHFIIFAVVGLTLLAVTAEWNPSNQAKAPLSTLKIYSSNRRLRPRPQALLSSVANQEQLVMGRGEKYHHHSKMIRRLRRRRPFITKSAEGSGDNLESAPRLNKEDKSAEKQPSTSYYYHQFDDVFREELDQLFRWRRDVRKFRTDPVDPEIINTALFHAFSAPSVGNSQPWRYVIVEDERKKQKIIENFKVANSEALNSYSGEKREIYAKLKLSGLQEAPLAIAVFCESDTPVGHGLGRRTMPGMLEYSVVASIQQFWLSARAHGVGVGWVSIFNEPENFWKILDVPSDWKFIAMLSVGYPQQESTQPELVRYGWQEMLDNSTFLHRR